MIDILRWRGEKKDGGHRESVPMCEQSLKKQQLNFE